MQRAVNNKIIKDQDPAFSDAWARLSDISTQIGRRTRKLEYRQKNVAADKGKKAVRVENPTRRHPAQTFQNSVRRSLQNLKDVSRLDDVQGRRSLSQTLENTARRSLQRLEDVQGRRSLTQTLQNTARRSPQRLENATRPDHVTKEDDILQQGTADLHTADVFINNDEDHSGGGDYEDPNDAQYEDCGESENEGSDADDGSKTKSATRRDRKYNINRLIAPGRSIEKSRKSSGYQKAINASLSLRCFGNLEGYILRRAKRTSSQQTLQSS